MVGTGSSAWIAVVISSTISSAPSTPLRAKCLGLDEQSIEGDATLRDDGVAA